MREPNPSEPGDIEKGKEIMNLASSVIYYTRGDYVRDIIYREKSRRS